MTSSTCRLGALFALVAIGTAGCLGDDSSPAPAPAPAPAPLTAAQACDALNGATIAKEKIGLSSNGARISTATLIAAAGTLPEYCDVRGAIARVDELNGFDINFRVNLPTDWNQKAMQFGGGGYNGSVVAATGGAPSALPGDPVPLARGYATFGSDSGHVGGNASFGVSDEAVINFGYAQMKKTRDVAVELLMRRYGKAPTRTYWVGSSQGGREGLTVAQRFPADYDGVLARVPVLSFTGLQIEGNRVAAALAAPGGWLNAAKVQVLHNAVMAQCDAADGLQDGVIASYASCTFDATTLRCAGGTDLGDTCLSDAQIATLNAIHTDMAYGYTVANAVQRYYGWGWGHENDPANNWRSWVTGTSASGGLIASLGSQFVRYFVAKDAPGFDPLSTHPVNGFTTARFQTRISQLSPVLDATNPDLTAFRDRGGKLLIEEHGGDYARSPKATIAYYNSVVTKMGGQAETDKFVRMFLTPGADHGGVGASGWPATSIDWVTILENWVEKGIAPSEVLETVRQNTTAPFAVTDRRALCQFPKYPRYNGGDRNTMAGYTCS